LNSNRRVIMCRDVVIRAPSAVVVLFHHHSMSIVPLHNDIYSDELADHVLLSK
jgi:hypothetical protein